MSRLQSGFIHWSTMVRKKNKSSGRRFLNISVLLLEVETKKMMPIQGVFMVYDN